jgi:putative tryptophan/tyrosine transport system substrate-binding protein
MRRREFIAALGGTAATWPLAARAQRGERVRRVGVLISSTEDDPQVRRQTAAFQQGLLDLGWMEGRNVHIDFRFLGDEPNRLKTYAAELVALKPDALLASGPTAVVALQEEAITIPVVFTQVNDPVGAGLVETLARPGGNVTGVTPTEFSIGGKMLEVLRDLTSDVGRVGVILDAKLRDQIGMWNAMEAVARGQQTCRSSSRPSTNWRSTLGPAQAQSTIQGLGDGRRPSGQADRSIDV